MNPIFLTRDLAYRLDVRQSGIHGRGVFARQDFQTGDYIGTYWGTKAREVTPYTLHVQNEDGTLFLIEGRNLLRYINHSDDPNAEFDGIHLIARRCIVAGEEITFDYSAGEGISFTH
ncbi:SET domain-containing protein [Thiolapillus brandeum]|nr:SET domain-containing protein-lysine N-methyltransferase [Thiolapillus brandeum]